MTIEDISGLQLGPYQVIAMLGRGGMGVVYRANQTTHHREVALKVLPPALSTEPTYRERFEREIKISIQLEHPHIVPIYDFGILENVSYVAMRLLLGGSLSDRIYQRQQMQMPPLPLSDIADLLRAIAGALDYAHRKGVIHRDIKPSNIMFDADHNPFLVDFGIAKLVHATSLTNAGMMMGTPPFMAPEQWLAQPPVSATDQYALGIMVYALVTDRLPFEAPTPYGFMHLHLNVQAPPPQSIRDDLPPSLEPVLRQALAKNPQDRFPTAIEFAKAFEAAIQGIAPTPSQPVHAIPKGHTLIEEAAPAHVEPHSIEVSIPDVIEESLPPPVVRIKPPLAATEIDDRRATGEAEVINSVATQIEVSEAQEADDDVVMAAPDDALNEAAIEVDTPPANNSLPRSERVRATPVATAYAESLGIDLADVPGTGRDGQVLKSDVQRWHDAQVMAAPLDATPEPEPEPARRLAEQHGLDLHDVQGTGHNDIVVLGNVEAADAMLGQYALKGHAKPKRTVAVLLVLIGLAVIGVLAFQPDLNSLLYPEPTATLPIRQAQVERSEATEKLAPDNSTAHVDDATPWATDRLEETEVATEAMTAPASEPQTVVADASADDIIVPTNLAHLGRLARYQSPAIVLDLAFSPDGQTLALAGDTGLELLSVPLALTSREFVGASGLTSLAYSPDGQRILTGGTDKRVRVWRYFADEQTFELEWSWVAHSGNITSVAYSSNGIYLLSGDVLGLAQVWRASTRTVSTGFYTRGVYSVTFSPDSRKAATGSSDGIVRIWDVGSGTALLALAGHAETVLCVDFSPSGAMLLSGSDDGTVRVWDAIDGEELYQWQPQGGAVVNVDFSPDAQLATAGTSQGYVAIWKVASGDMLLLDDHQKAITGLAFSRDGRYLATASSDGTVILWGIVNKG